MATIGLDKLFYAKITEDADGIETYVTPTQLQKPSPQIFRSNLQRQLYTPMMVLPKS